MLTTSPVYGTPGRYPAIARRTRQLVAPSLVLNRFL